MRQVRIALIGCGMFFRGMHIPNLTKTPKFRVIATMDVSESAAQEAAQEAQADYWTCDLNRILGDQNIDAVVIATRHDSHADLSVSCADAGKHILCEKPMALNTQQCRAITDAVRRNGVKYTVGYNRGMAPLVTKARDLLSGLGGKKMIYHRIQAPFPADHWTHDPLVGGGRFVGEGCHIFDLFCELVQSEPVMVYAAGGIFLDPECVKIPDSATVTITFADGSVATTLISSAGCADFPKEATEVYCDHKAIYIHDFTEMSYYGFDGHNRIRVELDSVDKGHAIELDRFADSILNDTAPPNGLVQAARAAVISFKVDESIATGLPGTIRADEYVF